MKIPIVKNKPSIVFFLFKYESILTSLTIFIILVGFYMILDNYMISIILTILSIYLILKGIKHFVRFKVNSLIIGYINLKNDGVNVKLNDNKIIIFNFDQIKTLKFETDEYLFHKNYKVKRNTGLLKISIGIIDNSLNYIGVVQTNSEYIKLLNYLEFYQKLKNR